MKTIAAITIILVVASILYMTMQRKRTVDPVPADVKDGDAWRTLEFLVRQIEDLIAPGVSTRELEQRFESLLPLVNAVGYFKGYRGYPSFISTSINDEVVHGVPSSRRLRSGDLLKFECGIKKHGQHAYLGWTYAVGSIDPSTARLLTVGREAVEMAAMKVADGVTIASVSHALASHLESNGLSPSRDFVGYRIGQQAHMAPQIPCFSAGFPDKGPRYHEGETYVLLAIAHAGEPLALVKEDGWTVFSADHRLTILFSMAVTPSTTGRILRTSVRQDRNANQGVVLTGDPLRGSPAAHP